ncbi:MAG: hypothetical protein OHK0053_34580 [Microscillaceae bacterium]
MAGLYLTGIGAAQSQTDCLCETFAQIGPVQAWDWVENKSFYAFIAGMAIDADGSPRAYHPENKGLDELSYAGSPGNWWALVTDNGQSDGNPLLQGPQDPYPGYFISTTSLNDRRYPLQDPRRYVNAEKIPYVVLSPSLKRITGTELGDLAYVKNLRNGKACFAIFADVGPEDKLGEGSIYLAEQLGIPANPRRGGQENDVLYLIFPFSGNRQPRPLDEIDSLGKKLMEHTGAHRLVKDCGKTLEKLKPQERRTTQPYNAPNPPVFIFPDNEQP